MELSFLVLIDHIIKNHDTFFRKYYIRYEMSPIFRQKMSAFFGSKMILDETTKIWPPGKFLNSGRFSKTLFRKYYFCYEMSSIFRQKCRPLFWFKNYPRQIFKFRLWAFYSYLEISNLEQLSHWIMNTHDHTKSVLFKYRMRMNINDLMTNKFPFSGILQNVPNCSS